MIPERHDDSYDPEPVGCPPRADLAEHATWLAAAIERDRIRDYQDQPGVEHEPF